MYEIIKIDKTWYGKKIVLDNNHVEEIDNLIANGNYVLLVPDISTALCVLGIDRKSLVIV